MTGDLDPLGVDRELARLAPRWRAWRWRLRRGDVGAVDPFQSVQVAGKASFDAVSALVAGDLMREPLRRWIYRLAEQRINGNVIEAIGKSRAASPVDVNVPEQGRFAVGDLLVRALYDRPRRADWYRAFVEHGRELGGLNRLLWARRCEVASRMGLASADVVELPFENIAVVAQRWLDDTADAAAGALPRALAPYLEVALGAGAEAGWPARLGLRPIADLLDEARLMNGLELDVGPLPRAIAPASFVRALARLGAAWVDATAPKDQPFVIAHDPYGLRRRTVGALFATLPMTASFVQKRLGVDRKRTDDFRRATSRLILAETRLAALRVRLRAAALAGEAAWLRAFPEHVHEALGFDLGRDAAGLSVRLHVDDGQRFAGWLLAAGRNRALTDAHDEDWFRNPRAADQLRSKAALSPEAGTTEAALSEGADVLCSALFEALD